MSYILYKKETIIISSTDILYHKEELYKKNDLFFPQLLKHVIFLNKSRNGKLKNTSEEYLYFKYQSLSFSSLPTKSLSGSTFTDPANRPLCILIRYFSRFLFPFSGEPHFQIGRDNRPVSYAKNQPWYCYCS